MKSRLLLLVQTHAHAAALMDCIPHIKAHYDWIWVVYSPAVLADPATVEKEFDAQIADLTQAMRDCYGREDGAGGDAYKAKRDAAVLEKSAKVKEAWKALSLDAQKAAVDRLFMPFYNARPCANIAITQGPDHFETSAHVEFQNSLKAAMKTGFVPGDYVIAWPTSLPKGGGEAQQLDPLHPDALKPHFDAAVKSLQEKETKTVDHETVNVAGLPTAVVPVEKIDRRKKENRTPRTVDPRLKELMSMSLDDLGPIAFELGIKPNDEIAGKRMALVHEVFRREQEKATTDVTKY